MDTNMLSKVLNHYKRPEVQKAIVDASINKEAVGSFAGKGYGRRPDVLMYPNDVMELVKSGVTSFHISEETWNNPNAITINMKRQEYDDLRIGWDLVLDVDCPYWEFSKLTTWLFAKVLREHGIKDITTKFSGNKGFHVAVPFEAFPPQYKDQELKNLFPDGARKIAAYLLDYVSKNYVIINGNSIVFGEEYSYTISELAEKIEKKVEDLVLTYCNNCGKKTEGEIKQVSLFVCSQCEQNFEGEISEQYKQCPKCKILMERSALDKGRKCCGSPKLEKKFDPTVIVEVDTVLISPRHLFRAPYSMHEKSGLVSIPINTDEIMSFRKEEAEPNIIKVGEWPFLVRKNVDSNQGEDLIIKSFEHHEKLEQKKKIMDTLAREERSKRANMGNDSTYTSSGNVSFGDNNGVSGNYSMVGNPVPEEFFPPCIKLLSKGLKDGKKRAVFMLTNFLASCGWDYEDIEFWIKDWNARNPEPLRDQYFLGQIRYAKTNDKRVLPPNCDNEAYYRDFGVCKPDNFCQYIKNPANYAIRKFKSSKTKGNNAKKT